MDRKTYKINKKLSWIYLCNSDDSNVQATLKTMRHGFSNPLLQHDSDLRRDNGLWNSNLNLLKQIHNAEAYADKHANEIIGYLKFRHRVLGKIDNLRLYSGLITFENCFRNGSRIVTPTGQNPYELLRNVNQKLKRKFRNNSDKFVVGSGIETAIFKGLLNHRSNIYNVHEHLLIAVINGKMGLSSDKYTAMNKLSDYLSNGHDDNVTLSMRPLINRKDNQPVIIDDYSNNNDYNTINAFAEYIYKQGKQLPIAKSWKDYYIFKDLGLKKQHAILHAIIHTVPKGMRLRSCLNFKPRAENIWEIAIIFYGLIRSKILSHNKFLLYLLHSLNSAKYDENIALPFRFYTGKSPP